MSSIGLPELFLVLFLGAAYIFWLFTLVKVAQQEPRAGGRRTFWLVFVAVTQFLGAAIYWLQRRWSQPPAVLP